MATVITNPTTPTIEVPIAPQALLITNRIRGQIDLRAKYGAWINAIVGRLSTTAYTNAVDLIINKVLGTLAGSTGSLYSISGARSLQNYGRASALTASGTVTARVNTTSVLADATIVTKTSNAGLTAYNSMMCFLGATAPGSLTNAQSIPTLEVARTSGFTGAGPFTHTLSSLLGIIHTADDYLTTAPDVWDIWLPGNCVYDIIFDAYNIVAGAGAAVQAVATVYPSNSSN